MEFLEVASDSVYTQLRKLMELDYCHVGVLCSLMIDFPELSGIHSGSGTDSAMFDIA
jgi:hypothetical protein